MSRFGAARRAIVLTLLVFTGLQLDGLAMGLLTTVDNSALHDSDNMLVSMNNRPPGVSDFAMFAGPDELTLAQGSTASLTLFLWGLNRFSGTVRLSVTPSSNLFDL